MDDVAASELGQKYPLAVTTWTNAWERFVPFLAFPPALRRMVYATNTIESLNLSAGQSHEEPHPVPRDEAVVKLL